jgi:hypothetical protein
MKLGAIQPGPIPLLFRLESFTADVRMPDELPRPRPERSLLAALSAVTQQHEAASEPAMLTAAPPFEIRIFQRGEDLFGNF